MSTESGPIYPYPRDWQAAPGGEPTRSDGLLIIGRGPILRRARYLAPLVALALALVTGSIDSPPPSTPVQLEVDSETLALLERTEIPVADSEELARRFGKLEGDLSPLAALAPKTGDQHRFWISNMHGERFHVPAELKLETAHAYFWVQDQAELDNATLSHLGLRFDREIHANTLSLFGGATVTEDPKVHILFSSDLGPRMAGYFSPEDLLHPAIMETSNGRRLLVINSELLTQSDLDPASLLAHELQHMIHWGFDSDESAWIQEGLSELATRLGGFEIGSRELAYFSQPDLQLNTWPLSGYRANHYGAASLFIAYVYDRFGASFVANLSRHPSNGLEGLDATLRESKVRDADSQGFLSSEQVVMDWALANYLRASEGPYAYRAARGSPRAQDTEVVTRCSGPPLPRTVSQYGVDYVRITCPGNLAFEGALGTPLIPTHANSGEYFFWSNRADQADTKLTRAFDFSARSGPITFRYWTWFEIEKDRDYLYLLASEDGQDWQFLQTPAGTDRPSAGISYGWGYTSVNRRSDWSEQVVDLSDYAGKRMLLRFEYVTDAALTGEGFLVDDLSIPEIGYASDLETDAGGWEAEGFVRVRNVLPQSFRLSLIRLGPSPIVESVSLDRANRGEIGVEQEEEVVLVVMGTTRHTRQPAEYTLSFSD